MCVLVNRLHFLEPWFPHLQTGIAIIPILTVGTLCALGTVLSRKLLAQNLEYRKCSVSVTSTLLQLSLLQSGCHIYVTGQIEVALGCNSVLQQQKGLIERWGGG